MNASPRVFPGKIAVWIALVAMTFAVFGGSLRFGLVNIDDEENLLQNRVRRGISAEGTAWAFTHTQCNRWNPLATLSRQLDWTLHGAAFGRHHLTNVLLHALNACLCFSSLFALTAAPRRSAVVAALLAVHPLHVEPVAWLSGRSELLAGLFFFLSLLAYRHWTLAPSTGRYLLLLAAFIPGLLSKQTLVALPLLLLVLDAWPLGRLRSSRDLLPRISEKAPLLLLSLCAAVAAVVAQRDVTDTAVPLAIRIGNAPVALWTYVADSFLPRGLAVFYPVPSGGWGVWMIAASAIGLVVVTAGAIGTRPRFPFLVTGWLWFLLLLLPVIGIVYSGGDQSHADRYTYLSQTGLFLAVVWLAAELISGLRHGLPLAYATALLMLGVCIVFSRIQTAVWRESGTLWQHALSCTEENTTSLNGMGNSFYARGDFSGATPWFQKSAALFPGHPGSLVNLANCSFKAGRPGEAEPLYLRALAVKPDSREALLNQGTLLLQSGRRAEAIPCFRRLVELEPENPAFARNLSWILATAPAEDQRNGPEALALALTADRFTHGNDPSILRALAAARAETGDFQGAQRDARRALELSAAGHRPTAETAELERELSLYRRNLPLHVDR